MSDFLLTPQERLQIALRVFGSDDGVKPIFPRRGESIQEFSLELAKAQSAKTKKGLMGKIEENTYYFEADEVARVDGAFRVIPEVKWQALKKEVEDG